MIFSEEKLSHIRYAFDRMGYREGPSGSWRKPVGLHTFLFTESEGVWSNACVHYDTGEFGPHESLDLGVWVARYPDCNILQWLKNVEACAEMKNKPHMRMAELGVDGSKHV